MLCNQSHFPGGQPSLDTKLDGFNLRSGTSAGGLKSSARVVTIPTGALLFRCFMDAEWEKDHLGSWWFTPFEVRRIMDHFGVDMSVILMGRGAGKSALHGALALLWEWYSKETDESGKPVPNTSQLSLFHAAKARSPMYALYGEGDVASTNGYSRVLKPMRVSDGRGGYSAPRQIFLPKAQEYRDRFSFLTGPKGKSTDQLLSHFVVSDGGVQLPFEGF